jgi:hypothetical protein
LVVRLVPGFVKGYIIGERIGIAIFCGAIIGVAAVRMWMVSGIDGVLRVVLGSIREVVIVSTDVCGREGALMWW